jgi:hypothetical protein
VAIKSSAGTLLVVAAMLGIGLPFGLLLRRITARVPTPIRAAGSAVLVTLGVTMAWSGMLSGELSQYRGILWPQQVPAFIGVFTFVLACCTPLLQGILRPVLQIRDKIPKIVWVGVAITVPLLTNLVLFPPNNAVMSESSAMTRQQLVVMTALLTGTVALFPAGRGARAITLSRLLAPLATTASRPT